MINTKWTTKLLWMLALTLLFGCNMITPKNDMTTDPVVLNYNWGEPLTADPNLAYLVPSANLIQNLFMGLTRLDPDSSEAITALATEWSANEDGTVHTFTLRNDVPWVQYNPETDEANILTNDEQEELFVTADDIAYSIRRTLDPEGQGWASYLLYGIENALAINSGEAEMESLGVTVIDAHTIQFTLQEPSTSFPQLISSWVANPVPAYLVEKHGDTWTEPGMIASNGAYLLKEWKPNESLDLVKNPYYPSAEAVQIEQIDGVLLTDRSIQLALFEAGQLDSSEIPVADYDRIINDPVYAEKIQVADTACINAFSFNMQKAPMDNLNLRKAFIHAIDKQLLIDKLVKNGADVADTWTPPILFGLEGTSAAGLSYDTTIAQEALQAYLAETGTTVDQLNEEKITIFMPTIDTLINEAIALQGMWKDVLGVDVLIDSVEDNAYYQVVGDVTAPIDTTPHLFRLSWCADYVDPYNALGEIFHVARGYNMSRRNCTDAVCSDVVYSDFDELIDSAVGTQDSAERTEKFQEANRILAEDEALYLPLYHDGQVQLVHPELDRNFPQFNGDDIYNWEINVK